MEGESKLQSVLFSAVVFVFGVAIQNASTGPITLLSFILWLPLVITHIVASMAYFRGDMPWLVRCATHWLVYFLAGLAFIWLMSSGFNSLKLGSVQIVEDGTLTQAGWLHYLSVTAMYSGLSLMALLVVVALRRALRIGFPSG